MNKYDPDHASPPGETLLELIEDLGISQLDLALRMNIDVGLIAGIIQGVAPITPEIALAPEWALSNPTAIFWENRERLYRKRNSRWHLINKKNDEMGR